MTQPSYNLVSTLRVGGSSSDLNRIAMEPSGMKVSKNDVDVDSGRETADGTMVRNRVATKYKITLRFPATKDLNAVTELMQQFAPKFVYVQYFNPYTGEKEKSRFYAGDIEVPWYSWKLKMYDAFEFSIIER